LREGNEDSFVVTTMGAAPLAIVDDAVVTTLDLGRRPVLLAVSDGMGGAAAGEIASALTIESLRRSLRAPSGDWDSSLTEAVARANRDVWNASAVPERKGMGATLTAVCLHGHDAHVAEVGDSRAYLWRAGKLEQLTKDQSYVQHLLDSGMITDEEAESSPMRNMIVSAMGVNPTVRVDVGSLRLVVGDTLLVCSDGLTNELTADEIAEVLTRETCPAEACDMLVRIANENGGRDNVTVIVANVDPAA
ncbi:MAG: PP2C family serine/threonine-protein phosphatase, partial [Polyangiaceae bacterium]